METGGAEAPPAEADAIPTQAETVAPEAKAAPRSGERGRHRPSGREGLFLTDESIRGGRAFHWLIVESVLPINGAQGWGHNKYLIVGPAEEFELLDQSSTESAP